jgi:hypothetical protein
MNISTKVSLILATLVVVTLVTFWVTTNIIFPYQLPFGRRSPESIPGDMELYYTVQTAVSTVNLTLLIILLVTYINIYVKTRSEFTIGLIIFSTVLLLNALASNPLLDLVFGFRAFGLGPFAMLPDLFTLFALTVLLYFIFKY